jgi:large subunit ribosomal protein L25
MEAQSTSTVGKLSATVRKQAGTGIARKIREKGLIPAVLYGGQEGTVALALDPLQLKKALDPGKRQNTVIELTLDDEGQTQLVTVMLKDYQVDTIKQTVIHADFVRVSLDQMVDVSIPLLLEGRPEGVKLGGKLHQVFRSLPIRCTPTQIPTSIVADVSALEMNQSIQVKDLALPEGVRIAIPDNQTVALVIAPKRAALEEEAAVLGEGEAAAAAAPAEEGAKPEEGKEKGKEKGKDRGKDRG